MEKKQVQVDSLCKGNGQNLKRQTMKNPKFALVKHGND